MYQVWIEFINDYIYKHSSRASLLKGTMKMLLFLEHAWAITFVTIIKVEALALYKKFRSIKSYWNFT